MALDVEWDKRVVRKLTRHQLEMLAMAAEGHSNKEIGRVMGISHKSVAQTFTKCYQTLGARCRTEAVVICWRRGWIR